VDLNYQATKVDSFSGTPELLSTAWSTKINLNKFNE